MQECLFNNHILNEVDRGVISMYLEEYFGNFLFGVNNPYRCQTVNREEIEKAILEKVTLT